MRKLIIKAVAPFAIFGAGLPCHATQNLNGKVQHVIVIIQENRTPDNLFNQDSALAGVGGHVQPSINGQYNLGPCQNASGSISLQPADLGTCWDPDHSHSQRPNGSGNNYKGAWNTMWDNGAMDGACGIFIFNYNQKQGYCTPAPPVCTDANGQQDKTYPYCPAMTYAKDTNGILEPYFQIANKYGWANYMFQTNQGPSFPAHQFLFSGTSAPVAYGDPMLNCSTYPDEDCWTWFAAENESKAGADKNNGCIADSGAYVMLIDPSSNEWYTKYSPPSPVDSAGLPCYDHPTLPDILPSGVTWKYYARRAGDIWTAPNAIDHICKPSGFGPAGTCTGADFMSPTPSGVVLPPPTPGDQAAILTDIANCNLANVSWVIPDGNWSDHNEFLPGDGGPSWVAAIVNAVGENAQNGKHCDNQPDGYWDDTVILITWDDWGGFYDDVSPAAAFGKLGYSNGSGAQYVYSFRVPLLVVSAWNNQTTSLGGYISGPTYPPDCAHNTYCHDFGSILNFVEYAFGTGNNSIGEISPSYHYADALVQDAGAYPNHYSLYDFFSFGNTSPEPFIPITGWKYPPSCFHSPWDQGCFPTYPVDPDSDASEN